MVVVSTVKETKVPPSGPVSPFTLFKNVVTDPGIIYGAADVLMFAKTNMIGFAACLAAVGAAAGLKVLDATQPKFLKKYPQVAAAAFDDRTPLRAAGLALMLVGGTALAMGNPLPAAASIFLALANFKIADSISRQDHAIHKKIPLTPAKPVKPSMMATLFKRPDLYLNLGFGCAGLMTGGASLFVLPLVGVAFCVGVGNVMQGKPEHAGHPKMITAMAALTFAGIGFAGGHGLIAAAHLLNGLVIIEFERRITPGGSLLHVLKEPFYTLGRVAQLDKAKKLAELVPQIMLIPESSQKHYFEALAARHDFKTAVEQKAPSTKPAETPAHKWWSQQVPAV